MPQRFLALSAVLVLAVTPLLSSGAPASAVPMNLGLLARGGTVTASSTTPLTPNQAFDGVLFAESKASMFENGWVARSGVGSWIERRWPGSIQLYGVTLTRRSNASVPACSRATSVEISTGKNSAVVLPLAATNQPQRFSVPVSSTKFVRITVKGVEGVNCTVANAGFSEIELWGLPHNWIPGVVGVSPTQTNFPLPPDASIQLAFDSTIPADAQAYLTTVSAQVLPVMTEVLGPPLASQTLTIHYNPFAGSFTYSPAFQSLTISRLPFSAASASDPLNQDFNARLAHEFAHAYQYGYGSSAPAWFREGFAQTAADLTGLVLAERGVDLVHAATVDAGMALRTYDSVAAGLGPETLGSLWDTNGRTLSYANAQGLWWLLTLSQSSPRVNGTFAELDFLRRVESALPAVNPASNGAGRRSFLALLSPNAIDGLPANVWLARQPIVWAEQMYGNALGFVPLDCTCSAAASASPQHLAVVMNSYSGSINGTPIRIVLNDSTGATVTDETLPFTDFGVGYWWYTFPRDIASLPVGRYDVTISGTINGTPLTAYGSIAVGSRTVDATEGLGLYRRLANAANPLTVATSAGTYAPMSSANGTVQNIAGVRPGDQVIRPSNQQEAHAVFVPAPFTRFVALP